MALMDQSELIIERFEKHSEYLKRNHKLFDIYEGNLLPYVQDILQASLSKEYYDKIHSRVFPVNILKRVIDKLAKAYQTNPTRSCNSNEEILEFYEETLRFNYKMNYADEFAHLFKGYALEPFINMGQPGLRVIPFDRFFVIGEDLNDPLRPTIFVKIMGTIKIYDGDKEKEVQVLFAYSDEEFLAITEEGQILPKYMEENEGINPIGRIPFYYGNRSEYSIMPVQDTDMLELSKLLPVLFTDLGGSIMFQCFSIIYGIDVDLENANMSPNAFWTIKSDPQSDKKPELGTITPQADINKVLDYIKAVFSTWMETRGIKVGSIGSMDANGLASGVAKIIDEMDTFEARKKSIEAFKVEEKEFWKLLIDVHNYWVKSGELKGVGLLPADWKVTTEFDKPSPMIDRVTEVNTIALEVEKGFLDQRSAIEKLYPDLSKDEVDERLLLTSLEPINTIQGEGNDLAESENRDIEGA